ncbi:hypothetical protein KUF71_016451 [Frankliniella fusca]|uniref:Uncharacterized protein n=1 Tax=Frankliniella fusca TaxID=407009 RepID=A0AAE1LRW4_9NEOP|nr:hypothetical protein KUF71_016451 [Frankliniella fusca]
MSSSDSSTVPTRRRSSILKRISVGSALSLNNNELARKHRYMVEAKQETQEWINLAKERRQQAKIAEAALSEISVHPPVLTFEDVRGDLRPEDLEFLARRPNYEKIVSDTDNFIEKVGLVKTKFEEVDSLINYDELLVKSRVQAIASNICSLCDELPYVKESTMS